MAKKEKKPKVDLKRYAEDFVKERCEALKELVGKRDEMMERYERIYTMDMWENEPEDGEKRVTSPKGFQTVQQMTALLVTRPHTINVKHAGADPKDEMGVQKVESFLYGMRHRTNLDMQVWKQVWSGNCLGEGILRAPYFGDVAEDDFPIQADAPDPRTVYGRLDRSETRFIELAHCWQRTRREIEDEWGLKLKRPRRLRSNQEQDWLDGSVEYCEYFDEVTVQEERTPEKKAPKKRGVIEMAAEMLLKSQQGFGAAPEGAATADAEMEMPEGTAADTQEDVAEGEDPNNEDDDLPRMVKVRKVVHCVLVCDEELEEPDQFVKKPVVFEGYGCIPYFLWTPTKTGLAGEKRHLSLLYAMTNGSGGSKSLGAIQAWNEFMSLFLTITEKNANPIATTTDDGLDVDTRPGAVNVLDEGKTLGYVVPPPPNSAVMRAMDLMGQMMAEGGIPAVLQGGQIFNLSGQAITGLSSVFEMTMGFMQQQLERTLSKFYEHVMKVGKFYMQKDERGWQVDGYDRKGNWFSDTVKADDLKPEYRVEVKLSSSLPKDVVGMMGLIMQMVKSELMSRTKAQDFMQKYLGEGQDTPLDEQARMMMDKILMSEQITQALTSEKSEELLNLVLGRTGGVNVGDMMRNKAMMPPPPQPGPEGGFAPTSGMPPSAVPPTPGGVGAAGNVSGMMAMMGQGQ